MKNSQSSCRKNTVFLKYDIFDGQKSRKRKRKKEKGRCGGAFSLVRELTNQKEGEIF